MDKVILASFASVVSELQQSDIYMTVKARICETPKPNLNGVRVTSAFIDEIVDNSEKYVGLPLNADVKALAKGRYDRLGHLYDARTGEYHSTQIGSFYKFEKEEFSGGAYLVGYARIMKRNKAICKAVAELFGDNALKFSFEISCGEYSKLTDGTIEIDASENNFLEGAAVVSFPACEDAVALELVAEINSMTDDGEGEKMTDVNEVVINEEVIAEAVEEEQKEEAHEEVTAEQENVDASVYVTEVHRVTDTVSAYDTCSNESVEITQTTEIVTHTSEDGDDHKIVVDEAANVAVAETTEQDPEKDPEENPEQEEKPEADPEEEPENEDASCKKEKKNAEEEIAELRKAIENLTTIVAELREQKAQVNAEQEQVEVSNEETETINPFMGSLAAPKKYSLLEKADETTKYTLLDKA